MNTFEIICLIIFGIIMYFLKKRVKYMTDGRRSWNRRGERKLLYDFLSLFI